MIVRHRIGSLEGYKLLYIEPLYILAKRAFPSINKSALYTRPTISNSPFPLPHQNLNINQSKAKQIQARSKMCNEYRTQYICQDYDFYPDTIEACQVQQRLNLSPPKCPSYRLAVYTKSWKCEACWTEDENAYEKLRRANQCSTGQRLN